MDSPDTLSTDEAGALIGVSGRHVRDLIVSGLLDGQETVRGWRVSLDDVEEYRARRISSKIQRRIAEIVDSVGDDVDATVDLGDGRVLHVEIKRLPGDGSR